MLPKLSRIKLNEDKYRRTYQGGKVVRTDKLRLVVVKSKKERPSRFEFIVPKRLDKRAAKRNRTRRLLSTSVHKLLSRVKSGHEVLVIGKKVFYKEKLDEVKPLVEEALGKAGLLLIILLL